MTTETFTWAPSPNAQGTSTFRVLTAQFGDGYKQAADAGINTEVQSWPLSFTGRQEKMAPILAFFRRHGGSKSFYWTPPMGEQGLYRAATVTNSPLGAGNVTLSATFEQVFAP
ncbi:phage tail protein [Silvimonas sp.]|uniref:phage tail protein n=1 Tax=Silvimonas sp. TaxID=2650811 RepID=UPI0028517945|nr:phage tail protein [Silvimonas sp.]MDR3427938.1 phage tail protein [Silvimonas sp.]